MNKFPDATLYRVVAPHMVAGLLMRGDICVFAAPILKWAIGKHRNYLRNYFGNKGWEIKVCPCSA